MGGRVAETETPFNLLQGSEKLQNSSVSTYNIRILIVRSVSSKFMENLTPLYCDRDFQTSLLTGSLLFPGLSTTCFLAIDWGRLFPALFLLAGSQGF